MDKSNNIKKESQATGIANAEAVSFELRTTTVFCIIRIVILLLSIFGIYITNTHNQALFVSALVYMGAILADYIIILLTTDKTSEQFKITVGVFIGQLIGSGIFLLGATNLLALNIKTKKMAFFNPGGECIWNITNPLGEFPVYLILIICSAAYILEYSGILQRKVYPGKIDYTQVENA